MRNPVSRGYAVVALDNPKNNLNVGSALRAAGCFGASMVIVGGRRNSYRRAPTDTMAVHRRLPLVRVADVMGSIPFDCVPIAVDIVPGARDLPGYMHPERAYYIFGAEDATLGARVLDRCRDVIRIPSFACLNLAAAVNVILYDRAAKAASQIRSVA